MNYKELLQKKTRYECCKNGFSKISVDSFNNAFEIEFTHNSTAIEGNTLTLMETKVLLEDGLSVGGKNIREIYEVVNHNRAFQYVKQCIADDIQLDEIRMKDIHAMLMDHIIIGGIYRNEEVRIGGAKHIPPSGNEMFIQIKNFFADIPLKKNFNPIELAAWTHAEFVRIHPFVDGNGRTSRLLTNYQLMSNGFLPVSIAKENRLDYYNTLEIYAVERRLEPFANTIAELEEEQLDQFLEMF